MSKHTPGPWRFVGGPQPATWNIETTGDFPRLICTVRESGRYEFVETEQANIRLIAAAPEMVELLGTLETAARRYANGDDVSSTYVCKLADKARALLDRIEGE